MAALKIRTSALIPARSWEIGRHVVLGDEGFGLSGYIHRKRVVEGLGLVWLSGSNTARDCLAFRVPGQPS